MEEFDHVQSADLLLSSFCLQPVGYHRQAKRAGDGQRLRTRCQELPSARYVDALAILLLHEHLRSASPATESLLARSTLHLDEFDALDGTQDIPRRIVDAVVAP